MSRISDQHKPHVLSSLIDRNYFENLWIYSHSTQTMYHQCCLSIYAHEATDQTRGVFRWKREIFFQIIPCLTNSMYQCLWGKKPKGAFGHHPLLLMITSQSLPYQPSVQKSPTTDAARSFLKATEGTAYKVHPLKRNWLNSQKKTSEKKPTEEIPLERRGTLLATWISDS